MYDGLQVVTESGQPDDIKGCSTHPVIDIDMRVSGCFNVLGQAMDQLLRFGPEGWIEVFDVTIGEGW